MTEYLRETRYEADDDDGYVEVWFVPPPLVGHKYRVVREEWINNYSERHIYEVKLEEHT